MYQQLDCIALKSVRHSDRHNILSVYTRQRGRMSFVVPAGQGREASRRRSLFMPGSRFSCVADIRDGAAGDRLPVMRDVMSRGMHPGATGDPVKSTVTLFLCDFLNTMLRDSMADEVMFDYCDTMLDFYATCNRGTANFHLLFLIRLTRFAGIEPDATTYRPGRLFDMMDAVFRDTAPLHGRFLDRRESDAAHRLMSMSPRNIHLWKFNASTRNATLDRLLEYYSLHFISLQSMKSLDVLRSLF